MACVNPEEPVCPYYEPPRCLHHARMTTVNPALAAEYLYPMLYRRRLYPPESDPVNNFY